MDENANRSFEPPNDRNNVGVPHFLPAFVWLIAIFLVGLLVGNLLWLFAADVLAFGREDQAVTFTVSPDASIRDIANGLKQQGLVNFAWLFRLYASLTDAQAKIKPGTYTLHARYDYHALVKALSAGKVSRNAATNTT